MRRLSTIGTMALALACSESSEPTVPQAQVGLLGRWSGTSTPPAGTSTTFSLNAVIAEAGGTLTGSGLLSIAGCNGSPYAVTISGARAGTAVSFTLLPRELNFTGTFGSDSIAGTLTGIGCAGFTITPASLVLRR